MYQELSVLDVITVSGSDVCDKVRSDDVLVLTPEATIRFRFYVVMQKVVKSRVLVDGVVTLVTLELVAFPERYWRRSYLLQLNQVTKFYTFTVSYNTTLQRYKQYYRKVHVHVHV